MEIFVSYLTLFSIVTWAGIRGFLVPLSIYVYSSWQGISLHNNYLEVFTYKNVIIFCILGALLELISTHNRKTSKYFSFWIYISKAFFSFLVTYYLAIKTFSIAATILLCLLAVLFVTFSHAGKYGLKAKIKFFERPFSSLVEEPIVFAGVILAIYFPIFSSILLLYFQYKCIRFLFGKTGGNEGNIALTEPSIYYYVISQYLSLIFLKIYNRMEIIDYENIPNTQLVFVANHASILDGFVLGGATRISLNIMVKKESFDNPITGWYLRKVFCFPVDRSRVDTVAIKRAMKVLKDGENLGLFPEGTRNREGMVGEFKPGAIKMALKRRLPIVPAYIYNAHLLTPPGTIFPRPAKMKVEFLEPIDTGAELDVGVTEEQLLEKIYTLICDAGSKIAKRNVRLIDE